MNKIEFKLIENHHSAARPFTFVYFNQLPVTYTTHFELTYYSRFLKLVAVPVRQFSPHNYVMHFFVVLATPSNDGQ
jgi:hypothetical protein